MGTQSTVRVLDPDAAQRLLELKDRALSSTAEGVTISDCSLPGNPIIYANEGFERITGYSVSDVVGRNCRFLQGEDTDPEAIEEIRHGLRENRELTVEILNYRKDGTPFWNRLSIDPVRDAEGRVTNYIGVQVDITERRVAEEALQRTKDDLESANQRMQRNLQAAVRVQQALLPTSTPDVPGVEFAWRLDPCTELAGDFLNFYRLADNMVGAYVLDVSGHGVAASLLSVTVSRMLSGTSRQSVLFDANGGPDQRNLVSPLRVAEKLNELFPFDPRTAQFFTLLYGLVDTSDRTFRYVSAGHLPPIRVPRQGEPTQLDSEGLPIGLFPDSAWMDRTVQLQEGDRVYLYTDGLVEAEDRQGVEFGVDRLTDLLASLRSEPLDGSLDQALRSVNAWTGPTPLEDDASILAIEVTG
ncbi:MAG: SpoIIE family protein phosphatase [Thermoanaerobaculia bacterium]